MGEEEGEQSNQSNLTCIGLSEGVRVEEKQACVHKNFFSFFFFFLQVKLLSSGISYEW